MKTKHLRQALAAYLCLSAIAASHVAAATLSVTYTYDAVGRVATALYSNGTCIAYSYDANGNRTSQVNTTSSAPESAVWGSGVWGCFSWAPQMADAGVNGRARVAAEPPHRQATNGDEPGAPRSGRLAPRAGASDALGEIGQ